VGLIDDGKDKMKWIYPWEKEELLFYRDRLELGNLFVERMISLCFVIVGMIMLILKIVGEEVGLGGDYLMMLWNYGKNKDGSQIVLLSTRIHSVLMVIAIIPL
jgi:hypothetical protein